MSFSSDPNLFSILPVGTENPGESVAKPLAYPPGQAPSTIPNMAPLHSNGMNQVIVVFKNGTSDQDIQDAKDKIIAGGGSITHSYTNALLGFSASVPDDNIQTLASDPQVNYVEPDGVVTAYARSLIS